MHSPAKTQNLAVIHLADAARHVEGRRRASTSPLRRCRPCRAPAPQGACRLSVPMGAAAAGTGSLAPLHRLRWLDTPPRHPPRFKKQRKAPLTCGHAADPQVSTSPHRAGPWGGPSARLR